MRVATGNDARARWADKPGSVVGRPFIYCGRRRPPLSRNPSAVRAAPWRSYLRFLRMGLAKPPCCHDAGGLLHHRFSFSLNAGRKAPAPVGVFFSAALSVGFPRPAVSRHPALWSPDFPHGTRIAADAPRPSGPPLGRYCSTRESDGRRPGEGGTVHARAPRRKASLAPPGHHAAGRALSCTRGHTKPQPRRSPWSRQTRTRRSCS